MYGGGGFGDNMGGGFQQGGFDSPSGGGDRMKRGRSQNIAPLTNADVASLKHDGNGFFLGETEVAQVTILGIVVQVDKSQTSVTYTIDDATAAPTTIKHWYSVESGDDDMDTEHVIYNEGTYVRVYAHLRSFQSKIALSALKILPVEDMNELTTHMLECLKFKMSLTKQSKAPPTTQNNSEGGYMKQSTTSSGVPNSGMDKTQSQVFDLIQQCDDETGVSIHDLKQGLSGMNNNLLRRTIDFLSNEGHIYSTIDDDHFKSTG